MRAHLVVGGFLAKGPRLTPAKVVALLAAMLGAVVALGLAASAASAATFSNNDGITFNDGSENCDSTPATAPGKGDPYPSQIEVSSLGSSISDVNVTISGLSHTYPDDVGLLLVSPAGKSTILMADSGGDPDVSGINLTFDDAASGGLPDESELSSGTYKPSMGSSPNGCSAPEFSFPDAPTGPYGSSLSVFNGTNPNGTWKLYVIDDNSFDTGSIDGWSLDISASTPAPTTFTVTNTNDSGAGSLRQAITDANATQAADTIAFDIPASSDPGCDPGSGVCTISPTTNLPTITDTVTIDGYTQPDAHPNTLASGDDAVLKVELDGTNAGTANGLSLLGPDSTGSDSSNSVIRGLVINDFHDVGISLGGTGNTIEGNFIGTDPSGTEKEGNLYGVDVGGTNNVVGGTSPEARNLISGNRENGVKLGPVLSFESSRNKIWGNYIGTQRDGAKPLGNGYRGVFVWGSSGNTIGGLKSEKANKIAFNGFNGVAIERFNGLSLPANSNRVLRNSIYSNGDLGIDLDDDGLTPNDNKDRDEGPNTLQNKPNLASATTTGTKITIQGTLRSTPNASFTVRFFANRSDEPRGYEGRTYLGTKSVSTDANGEVTFTKTLSAEVSAGQRITATATGPGGTSEFSAPQKVVEQ